MDIARCIVYYRLMRIHRFLVVDSNLDNGALLVRTLSRKFPSASIQLLRHDAEALRALSGGEAVAAIVLHRTDESDAVALIHAFKAAAPQVPIVAVSGVDRSEALLRAGAAGFLNYDEWLRIGTVVHNVLAREESESHPPGAAPAQPAQG